MISKFIDLTPITIGELLGFVGILILASIAIFQDKIRTWIQKPKLKASILLEPPDSRKIPVTNKRTEQYICDGYYFGLRIENCGNSVAENVEVFAKSLNKNENKKLTLVDLFLPMNFVWAHIGGMYFPAIAPGMYKHCDLGHILDPKRRHLIPTESMADLSKYGETIFSFEQITKSNNKGYLIRPGKYILEIIIAAVNARPKIQKFRLDFTGKWTDNEEEMLEKEISIEPY